MKLKIYISTQIIFILLILGFIFIPGINTTFLNPFQKQTLETKSLQEIKNIRISQFRSAEYNYKVLFPYDFIYGEPDWGLLLYKNSKFLTEEDKFNKEFYYKCRAIGIDLAKIDYFFILKTKALAGFDLETYLDSNPVLKTNEEEGIIELLYPESRLLSVELDDSLKEDKYPDVEITPGEWQKLITILLPEIKEQILEKGILAEAEKTNMNFIKELFTSMGWANVEFKLNLTSK